VSAWKKPSSTFPVGIYQEAFGETMESNLVRRDQFSITPQGIVHKPTDAAFTPHPGDPYSGISRLGQLTNVQRDRYFRPDDVQRMMRELWAEYVASNPQLFNAG
jgi:hypothetical protein